MIDESDVHASATRASAPISMEASYDDYPRIEEAFQELLDGSLDPRGPDSVYDLVAELDLAPGSVVVDVGCGEGDAAIALHARFGFEVHGIDPVRRHIELSSSAAQAAGVEDHVRFELGSAERIPVPDRSIDLVWCKEVLMFADLRRAFDEFARVLRPGGRGFIYQVFTGPEMTDADAESFWTSDGHGASVRPSDLEAAVERSGLRLAQRIDLGSEWGEYAQERHGAGGRRLVHVARLRRDPQRYIDAFGETNYRIMLTDCLWHVYRMIGKLHGAAFILTRPAG